jgi:murein DD-endopeptidase / murein LD-carboxypeptidase
MRRKAEEIVAAGRALIGARFRPQGRSIEQGLDCIGVAVMATGTDPAGVRRDYRLGGADVEAMNGEFEAHGFLRLAPTAAEAGDFLVVRPGPTQVHIVLKTELGYLHADTGLRRVVEVPGALPWPVLSAWRR